MSEVMAEAYDEQRPAEQLLELLDQDNVAEGLSDYKLGSIGSRCKEEYEEDEASMSEWRAQVDEGMKLAKQIRERKDDPWPNAANVKIPMISTATLRFAAEAYGELIRGGEVVKVSHPGLTPLMNAADEASAVEQATPDQQQLYERGLRIKTYMNYQLLEEMEEWEPELDKLCHILPIVGCLHKKTWFNPLLGQNDSRLCLPDNLTIHMDAKDIDRAPRISECMEFSGNEVWERRKMGVWRDIKYSEDDDKGATTDKVYSFIEQHRWLDLDDDGYEEPYVVTFEKDSGKVARIAARFTENDILLNPQTYDVIKIKAIQHYTKYGFIPNFDGGYWDIGWGHMLGPLNETANTLVNQLLDAGTLANSQGGFISTNVRLKEGGTLKFKMNEWKRVQASGQRLADSVFPFPVREPSNVLFLLLGTVIEWGEKLASVTDVMTGEQPGQNVPATTVLALIEQGKKVFSSIHKRIYRSLTKELRKLYRLNQIYADPRHYVVILNRPGDPRMDFNEDDMDVLPTANPELSSRFQRLAQAESLLQVQDRPGVDPVAITRQYVEALGIENPEQIVPPPNPEQQAKGQETERLQFENAQFENGKLQSEIMKNVAAAMKALAEAEATGQTVEIDAYKADIDQFKAEMKAVVDMRGQDKKPSK